MLIDVEHATARPELRRRDPRSDGASSKTLMAIAVVARIRAAVLMIEADALAGAAGIVVKSRQPTLARARPILIVPINPNDAGRVLRGLVYHRGR